MASNIIDFDCYLKNKDEKHVLFLETSEEMPDDNTVLHFMHAYAHRGFLQNACAILVGHPKTKFLGNPPAVGETTYRKLQKEAIIKGCKDYDLDIPIVFDMNFGHTDPQTIIPFGGECEIDFDNQTISIDYS